MKDKKWLLDALSFYKVFGGSLVFLSNNTIFTMASLPSVKCQTLNCHHKNNNHTDSVIIFGCADIVYSGLDIQPRYL